MAASEEAFGLPAGHSLRLVRAAPRGGDAWEWEHEERDARGALVAVYESWSRGAAPPVRVRGGSGRGGGGFVKYSPHGWVLSLSGRSPRLPGKPPPRRPPYPRPVGAPP